MTLVAPTSRVQRGRVVVGGLVALLFAVGCGPDGRSPGDATAIGAVSPERDNTAAPSVVVGRGEAVVAQTVYVPVYSHIYFHDRGREIDLAATLSVRNTDPERPIAITAVRYYDSDGRLVRRYVDAAVPLPPLSSRAYVVAERDRTGGVGASFVVDWQAEAPVSLPVVEAVMIGTAGSQGISFVSPGRVVRPLGRDSVEAAGP